MASSDVLFRLLPDGSCKQKFYYGTGHKSRDFNQPSVEYEAVTDNKQTAGCDAVCLHSDTRLSES